MPAAPERLEVERGILARGLIMILLVVSVWSRFNP